MLATDGPHVASPCDHLAAACGGDRSLGRLTAQLRPPWPIDLVIPEQRTDLARCRTLTSASIRAKRRGTGRSPRRRLEPDTSVIALWLGHATVRSTDAYVHADITIKGMALAMTAPAAVKPGRYRPPDKVLAFLEGLCRDHEQQTDSSPSTSIAFLGIVAVSA